MSDLFDFDKSPDRYAVMGNPVAHSKSPRIHALFAARTGQRLEYIAIQVDPGGFAQAVQHFAASGGKGLNVTVPFKEEACRLADELTARARQAGAVNTLAIRDGRLAGDNTDGSGLIRDLVGNHGARLEGQRILLMGAGGAARGVLGPLLGERPSEVVVANRGVDRALALASEFAALGPVRGTGYEGLAGVRFDIIVNATAASLQGELPPLPQETAGAGTWCYDMMYGAEPTPFMAWARECGAARVMDGLGMLVEQAAESFLVWRGVRPETAEVIAVLRAEMRSALP